MKMLDELCSKCWVIDVIRGADQPSLGALFNTRFKRFKKSSVSFGVVKGLAGSIQRGDAPFGEEKAQRSAAAVELLADPLAHERVLLGSGAHQGDLRVVFIEQSLPVGRRQRLWCAEVDHIQRPYRADI